MRGHATDMMMIALYGLTDRRGPCSLKCSWQALLAPGRPDMSENSCARDAYVLGGRGVQKSTLGDIATEIALPLSAHGAPRTEGILTAAVSTPSRETLTVQTAILITASSRDKRSGQLSRLRHG